MTYILNLETSTRNCSVSIALNGETLLCKEVAELGYSHAEKLHVFIEEILKEVNLQFSDLNAVAVSQGPGSYTGLRIGVLAAKGLCYAMNIPLIAVDTLQVMASKVKINEGLVVPMIDARRMEVYSSVFTTKIEKVREVKAEILTETSFNEFTEPLFFVGDCLEKAKTVLHQPNFYFLDDVVFPSAAEMSHLTYEKFKTKSFEDVAYFEPFYLKDFLVK